MKNTAVEKLIALRARLQALQWLEVLAKTKKGVTLYPGNGDRYRLRADLCANIFVLKHDHAARVVLTVPAVDSMHWFIAMPWEKAFVSSSGQILSLVAPPFEQRYMAKNTFKTARMPRFSVEILGMPKVIDYAAKEGAVNIARHFRDEADGFVIDDDSFAAILVER